MDMKKLMDNLKSRRFAVSHFATKEEATAYLVEQVKDGSCAFGGSKTLEAMGLAEKLKEAGVELLWHWQSDDAGETLKSAATTKYYFTSANAISEDGQIINIDGSGNRIASQVFGHKKVFIVAGKNKIAPDFEKALARARNEAAVKNVARFGLKNPCQVDGKCHDCHAATCICNALMVQWGPMANRETEVVLIDEELGF